MGTINKKYKTENYYLYLVNIKSIKNVQDYIQM